MNNLRRILTVLVMVMLASSLGAQTQQKPSWVYFGLGSRAYEQRNFDQALLYFREAIRVRGVYPEAEIMVGKILGIGPDQVLIRRQLEKALAQSSLLEVPQDKSQILYLMADLAARDTGPDREKLRQRETDILLEILQEDKVYQQALKEKRLSTYNLALVEDDPWLTGLNRILTLYRDRLDFSLEAHLRLARIYYSQGAWSKCLNHSLLSYSSIYSEILERFLEYEPLFTFKNLGEFHQELFNGPHLYQPYRNYMGSSGLLEVMEMISGSLKGIARKLGSGESSDAQEVYAYLKKAVSEKDPNKVNSALITRLEDRARDVENLRLGLIRDLLASGVALPGIF